MVKLPKSIIKKYGITKKAWAVFRGKGGGKKSAAAPKHHKRRKVQKKSGTPKARSNNGGEIMAKRKRSRGRTRVKARRAFRKVRAGMDTRPGKVLTMALEATAGAVVTSLAVNKTPGVSSLGRIPKAGIQGVLGLAAIFLMRNKHVKAAGAGAVIAAVMTAAKEILKVEPLAGPGARPLSPSELQRLSRGMNMPLAPNPARMNVPLEKASGNAGFRGGFGS